MTFIIHHKDGHRETYSNTYDEDDDYDQYDAKGFITLYGLPIKVKAKLDQKKKK